MRQIMAVTDDVAQHEAAQLVFDDVRICDCEINELVGT
jgi:hypothetical protein